MKGSFCLGQGQSHGTQALPGSAPTPPCTSSCAVSSLPKVFEALLQYQRRHAHRPALSSHVLAPRLFGLQRLPTALPLQKTLPPPRSHPLVTARLCPAAAPSPAGPPASAEGLWQQQQPVAGAPGPGRALPLAAHAGFWGRNSLLSSGDARQSVLPGRRVCFIASQHPNRSRSPSALFHLPLVKLQSWLRRGAERRAVSIRPTETKHFPSSSSSKNRAQLLAQPGLPQPPARQLSLRQARCWFPR